MSESGTGWTGQVEAIFTTPEKKGDMVENQEIEALAGRGLVGDRNCLTEAKSAKYEKKQKQYPDQVTLIAAEAVEEGHKQGVTLPAKEFRRNILTRGATLDDLMNREFTIGEVRLKGVMDAAPCGYLARLTGHNKKTLFAHMAGTKSGIRAVILQSGTIRVGDEIKLVD